MRNMLIYAKYLKPGDVFQFPVGGPRDQSLFPMEGPGTVTHVLFVDLVRYPENVIVEFTAKGHKYAAPLHSEVVELLSRRMPRRKGRCNNVDERAWATAEAKTACGLLAMQEAVEDHLLALTYKDRKKAQKALDALREQKVRRAVSR